MRGLGGCVVEVRIIGAVFGIGRGSVKNIDGGVGAGGRSVDEAFVVSVVK